MSSGAGMTPQEIVHELDKHIVGQKNAKKAVAIALRAVATRLEGAVAIRACAEGPVATGRGAIPATRAGLRAIRTATLVIIIIVCHARASSSGRTAKRGNS